MSKKHSPSSLWTYYSMLRSTISVNENLDIKSFQKLSAFIKRQNVGKVVKKAKVLAEDEFKKFLTEADDELYLLCKLLNAKPPSTINDIELDQQQNQFQPSTSNTEKETVVSVKNAFKHYGSNKHPNVVLSGLNMTVPKGSIYGLLGASGCGKTTLLGCILGQREINVGDIWVLGGPPGTKSSGVPGRRVGYMPQETALYGDFTIEETFTYFGWITGMDKKHIQEKFEMLSKLLMLPNTKQRVKTLSGGEQRRVTLASVLLHDPELLIMDEPTVGVDPLLRESIWSYLLGLSKEGNTTIIITTHYIEEARQADIVGLMRGGKLLAEEPPENLLIKYGTETLEEVFLKLCISQNMDRKSSIQSTSSHTIEKSVDNTSRDLHHKMADSITWPDEDITTKIYNWLTVKATHMKALLWKNMLWWVRNTPTFFFSTGLSFLMVASFCICIGHDPHDLPIAIVNHETNNSVNCSELTCNSTQLSCNYIEQLKGRSLILTYYDSEEAAMDSVIHGQTYASIIMNHNYSDALRARIENWHRTKDWDLDFSSIDVFRDLSNTNVASFLKKNLYSSFSNFIQEYLRSCEMDSKFLTFPIRWETPVYGAAHPNFTDFAVPGGLLSIVYLLAIILTANSILTERKEASFERTMVIGITEPELLIAHVISSSFIILFQSALAIITAFLIFNTTHEGSLLLVVFLTILSAFCGMCYGVLISCVCNSNFAVNIVAIGTFFPIIMLSGIVWPIEGMHYILQPISNILPLARPTESMRSILQRNWDLSVENVQAGFITVIVWAILLLTVSGVVLKFKKS